MKHFLLAVICLALAAPALAQTAEEPASRDDIILLLRTMHSHDFIQKMMAAQSAAMRQSRRERVMKEKGSVPADFDTQFTKEIDGLIKGMPMDEMMQAMIPAYQKHFTHGDIEAMNAFYSSPVGQKVLEELPAVVQEGMQEMMPILTKYINAWSDRTKKEMESAPAKTGQGSSVQN
jgi:uncharacterized protein